ncbi:hypothetical protein chiPu_0017297 [Chiloscyllium punctatum]|uniref:Uncharacterized protein n=1 Tax=Chiloscyllium punctatum TaxID=137246 RepID=A0A401RES2_CHIPU|nr:hypothetical protein [Chiloscyllium punctatum]
MSIKAGQRVRAQPPLVAQKKTRPPTIEEPTAWIFRCTVSLRTFFGILARRKQKEKRFTPSPRLKSVAGAARANASNGLETARGGMPMLRRCHGGRAQADATERK